MMVKIRPQPVAQWTNKPHEYQRSKSQDDELSSKMRSSIALEPSNIVGSTVNGRVGGRSQLSSMLA